jgi:hypothetical protein
MAGLMEFFRRYPLVLVAIVVAAVGVLGWTLWPQFARSGSGDHLDSAVGRIDPMSSMLGPDASGRPRTPDNPGSTPMPNTSGR